MKNILYAFIFGSLSYNLNAQNQLNYIETEHFPNLPIGIRDHSSAYIRSCNNSDGNLYVFGGYTGSGVPTTNSYKLDLQSNTWTTFSALPENKRYAKAATIRNFIYVAGGSDSYNQIVNTVYKFNPNNNSFTTVANMPTAVANYAIATYRDSLIYYIGGRDANYSKNIVQIYNPTSNTWLTGTPIPGYLFNGASASISGNDIIVIGAQEISASGNNTQIAFKGTINPNNPTSITWSYINNYPGITTQFIASGAAPIDDGLVYFAGGHGPNAKIYAYDMNDNEWKYGPTLDSSAIDFGNFVPIVQNDTLKFIKVGGLNKSFQPTNFVTGIKINTYNGFKIIASDSLVCTEQNVTLRVEGTNNYTWSPSPLFTNTNSKEQTLFITQNTQVSVKSNMAWGCAKTITYDIIFNPTPSATIEAVSDLCSSSGPIQLNVYPQGGNLSGPGVEANLTFNPATAGLGSHNLNYNVQTNNGCTYNADFTINVVECLSNNENTPSEIDIYPNPFYNSFRIKSNKGSIEKIQIINAAGIIVKEVYSLENQAEINLNHYPPGIYFVKTSQNSSLYKIVKF